MLAFIDLFSPLWLIVPVIVILAVILLFQNRKPKS
jgi:hypothetical protein